MLRPDYRHSIVNLMASISHAFDVHDDTYATLDSLAGEGLNEGPVVLWIIDGMGDAFLNNYPSSFLFQNRKARLTSVFPSTTASAITSFYTGVAPQQHAITGWFTYFRELGSVATVLPFNPRYRGPGFEQANITPAQFIGQPSLLSRIDSEMHVINPAYISDSAYSKTISGHAHRAGYQTLNEMLLSVERAIADGKRKLVIAYWAEFDGLSHVNGIGSDKVDANFRELDLAAQRLSDSCRKKNASLLITADHGLIDTDEAHTIHLDNHPELRECLTLPLCGEPRAAFCYVRARQRERFERYIQENFSNACELHDSETLIREGIFGQGAFHPELLHRAGDYTLLMKENYVIRDCIINERPFEQIGVHGGLSPAELHVPLIIPDM